MNFLLGLASLLAIAVRVLVMCIALVVITVAEWLERAQEWADRKRGIPIVQIGDEEPNQVEIDRRINAWNERRRRYAAEHADRNS